MIKIVMMLPQQKSAFAEKYGIDPKYYLHRSGYTPTSVTFPSDRAGIDPRYFVAKEETEKFQRDKCYGFTIRELIELDAISDRQLKQPTLQNPISEYFRIDPWYEPNPDPNGDPIRHDGMWDDGTDEAAPPDFEEDSDSDADSNISMESGCTVGGEDLKKTWTADNPQVKPVLEPVLRLASRLLTSNAFTPFFDTIFFSTRRLIKKSCLPDCVVNYKPGSGEIAISPEDLCQIKIGDLDSRWDIDIERPIIRQQLLKYLKFAFWDDYMDPLHNKVDSAGGIGAWAYTVAHPSPKLGRSRQPSLRNIFIFINLVPYKTLLRDDLTDSERLGLTWICALTIIHECAHAFDFLAQMRDEALQRGDGRIYWTRDNHTPFYDNEQVSEIGTAMEHHVADGVLKTMMNKDTVKAIPPLGFWRETEWPTMQHDPTLVGAGGRPWELLRSRPLADVQMQYPVPVMLIEDIHQEGFWDALQAVQGKIHQMRASPVLVRIILTAQNRTLKRATMTADPEPRLKQLEQMMRMDPSQLHIVTRIQDLVKAAKSGTAYWQGRTKQKAKTDAIMDEIRRFHSVSAKGNVNPTGKPTRTAQQESAFYTQLVASLEKVVEAHHAKITSLHAMEEANGGVMFTQQRASLLAFNRGTRDFIKTLEESITNLQERSQAHTNMSELIRLKVFWQLLEHCHLRIWDPNQPIGNCKDNDEYDQMDNVLKTIMTAQPQKALQLCIQATRNQDEGTSWFNECQLMIMFNSLGGDPELTAQDRLADVKEALNSLVWMRDEPAAVGGCPKWWTETLNKWIGNAKQIIEQLNPKSNPVRNLRRTQGRVRSRSPRRSRSPPRGYGHTFPQIRRDP